MVHAPGLWSSQGVIRVQLNSRWRAPGCTQGTRANVQTGRMRSEKKACRDDDSRSRPTKYLMSCVFLVSMLACSKCMKCEQILWEFCFSVIKPSLSVKLRAPFRIKRLSLEFCPLRSDILSARRPSGNKERICSTGTKTPDRPLYIHTRAARNKSWLSSLFISFQTALLKAEETGLLLLLVFMQSIKRSASKCWDTTWVFFCTHRDLFSV